MTSLSSEKQKLWKTTLFNSSWYSVPVNWFKELGSRFIVFYVSYWCLVCSQNYWNIYWFLVVFNVHIKVNLPGRKRRQILSGSEELKGLLCSSLNRYHCTTKKMFNFYWNFFIFCFYFFIPFITKCLSIHLIYEDIYICSILIHHKENFFFI